ncbi:MAG: GNAT family N-acetyltransferase, partial [Catenulispora sp.]|nr:GNAT family N-acetyltransferase [Catenulispora sp.]
WGTGAGHALMEAALARLRELGLSPVRLWALDGNERAARFYRRQGFALDGERTVYDFNGASLPISRYELDAAAG